MKKIEFQTSRLLVRPPIESDAYDIFKNYAQDREVVKYLTWEPHKNINMTIGFINYCIEKWNNNDRLPFSIYHKESKQVIGMLDFIIEDHGKANFGYVLTRKYWNQGYMTEAMNPVIEYILKMDSIKKVWAVHDVDNPASGKVMEKIGLRYECTIKNWVLHPNVSNKLRDCKLYSINR